MIRPLATVLVALSLAAQTPKSKENWAGEIIRQIDAERQYARSYQGRLNSCLLRLRKQPNLTKAQVEWIDTAIFGEGHGKVTADANGEVLACEQTPVYVFERAYTATNCYIHRKGGEITVELFAPHTAKVGDYITCDLQAADRGINGTYLITKVPDERSVTFISGVKKGAYEQFVNGSICISRRTPAPTEEELKK